MEGGSQENNIFIRLYFRNMKQINRKFKVDDPNLRLLNFISLDLDLKMQKIDRLTENDIEFLLQSLELMPRPALHFPLMRIHSRPRSAHAPTGGALNSLLHANLQQRCGPLGPSPGATARIHLPPTALDVRQLPGVLTDLPLATLLGSASGSASASGSTCAGIINNWTY